MFGSMAETAGLFVAYSQLQNLVRWSRARPASEDLSIAELGLAAGGAGFLTSFILSVLPCTAQFCVLF
jgi:ornithine carrier protein